MNIKLKLILKKLSITFIIYVSFPPHTHANFWTPALSPSIGAGFWSNHTDKNPRLFQSIATTYSISQYSTLSSEYLFSQALKPEYPSMLQEFTLGFRSVFDLFQIVPWASVSISGRWYNSHFTPTVGLALGADYKLSERYFISLASRYTFPTALIGLLQLGYTFELTEGFDPL